MQALNLIRSLYFHFYSVSPFLGPNDCVICLNKVYLTGQPLSTFCVQALQNLLRLAAGQDCGLCVSSSG